MASVKKRSDGKWRARFRDHTGKEYARHFDRRVDAQQWVDLMTADLVRGMFVDPRAGRVTFKTYCEEWRKIQVHRESTAAQVETNMRRHVYPIIGERQIGSVRPSEIQAMVKGLASELAPGTVELVYRYVVTVFKSAVTDRIITLTPCVDIKLPKVERSKVVPLSNEAIQKLVIQVPDRFRSMVILGAGTGLRQGEAFGLTVDRVDFLRKTLTVDRQLVLAKGGVVQFAPPKTDSSYRDVPLPGVVVDALAEHLAKYEPCGEPSVEGLIFTNDLGGGIARNRFSEMWRPAVKRAELVDVGFHELRHYYASLLIHHGESVKVVQDRLGHKTAKETLDTYGHLWPNSEDSTRAAVDSVLGPSLTNAVAHAAQ